MRTLEDGHRAYLLGEPEQTSLASPSAEAVPRPASAAEAGYLLSRLARDPVNLATMRKLAGAATLFPHRLSTAEVVTELGRLWAAGRLAVLALPAPALVARDGEEEEDEPLPAWTAPVQEQPRVEKTWIEIELLDENEKPVAGERYRIKLTDGTTYQGSLDTWGRARYPGLDPGECAVWFPDLAGKEWKAEGLEGEEDEEEGESPRGRRRTWVEIELLYEDGTPAAGEAYEITLPGGEVFRGSLDEEGTAFHGDLDPGSCTVTFPKLTAREWEASKTT